MLCCHAVGRVEERGKKEVHAWVNAVSAERELINRVVGSGRREEVREFATGQAPADAWLGKPGKPPPHAHNAMSSSTLVSVSRTRLTWANSA